ncbi:hypothetical protein C7431_11052 [Pantoea allii]|uniref:Uncharacterized protein n=1 Tax=Pantoea allii TaxID=574096 RepID=A0A2V2BD97_9GAMM|nr:DUF6750 family protein [Pantoea allii]PWK94558.1 hypothetical protein C7431_11052 [Pantoea allii]
MINRLYTAAFLRAFILSDRARSYCLRSLSALLVLLSPCANALTLADILNNLGQGADSSRKSILSIGMFIGVIAVVGGLCSFKAMKNNPNFRPWHGYLTIVVGAALFSVSAIIKATQAQAGLTPTSELG